MISVTVALLNGEPVLADLALNDFTTIGALQKVVAQRLGCTCDGVVLMYGPTRPSRFSTRKQIGVSDGDILNAILRLSSPHAQTIEGEYDAFAFVKEDGSVVTWGDGDYGGNSENVKEALTSGVLHVYSTDSAFAAVKTDGSVVTWGDGESGGNSEDVKEALTSGVQQIYSACHAFAAVKADGSVVTWG